MSGIVEDHEVSDGTSGDVVRPLLGLAAVNIERLGKPTLPPDYLAGDQSSANVGIPLAGVSNPEFAFGFPDRRPVCSR